MDKELKNLLDNYENVIYGQAFLINPSIHQLHLLLDYIANLEQQCNKQKEVIDKAIEYIKKYESIKAYYEYIDEDGYDEYNYDEDFKKELLDILNEVTNNE